MVKKTLKTYLAEIPAWAFVLMTVFITFIFGGFFDKENPSVEVSSFDIIIAIIYDVFLVFACFIICRTHPKSVWYTPIICSAPIISSYFIMLPFGTHLLSTWIILGGGIVFSVIGAIVGAGIGRRIINQSK